MKNIENNINNQKTIKLRLPEKFKYSEEDIKQIKAQLTRNLNDAIIRSRSSSETSPKKTREEERTDEMRKKINDKVKEAWENALESKSRAGERVGEEELSKITEQVRKAEQERQSEIIQNIHKAWEEEKLIEYLERAQRKKDQAELNAVKVERNAYQANTASVKIKSKKKKTGASEKPGEQPVEDMKNWEEKRVIPRALTPTTDDGMLINLHTSTSNRPGGTVCWKIKKVPEGYIAYIHEMGTKWHKRSEIKTDTRYRREWEWEVIAFSDIQYRWNKLRNGEIVTIKELEQALKNATINNEDQEFYEEIQKYLIKNSTSNRIKNIFSKK